MRHKVLAGLDAAKHIPWRGKQLLPEFLSALHSFLAFGDYSKDGENGGVLFSRPRSLQPLLLILSDLNSDPKPPAPLFPVVLEAGEAHRKLCPWP